MFMKIEKKEIKERERIGCNQKEKSEIFARIFSITKSNLDYILYNI